MNMAICEGFSSFFDFIGGCDGRFSVGAEMRVGPAAVAFSERLQRTAGLPRAVRDAPLSETRSDR